MSDSTIANASALTERGYGISKEVLGERDLKALKDELTVTPNNTMVKDTKSLSFKVYQESNKKIYVPKHYGLKKYGVPADIRVPEGDDIAIKFRGSLRDEQLDPVNAFVKACKDPRKMGGIINLSCGAGKCLARDTPVLMYNGNVKAVQDVAVGDHLMGDDGFPRLVQSTCRGEDELFKIVPDSDWHEPYTVNSSHILTLKHVKTGMICDVDIATVLSWSECKRKQWRGFAVGVHEFGQDGVHDPQYIDSSVLYGSYEKRLKFAKEFTKTHFVNGRLAVDCKFKQLAIELQFLFRSLCVPVKITNQHVLEVNLVDKSEYSFSIQPMGKGDYYGFEINGNRRFLLGDFTVTHNTVIGLYAISELGKKAMIVVHKDFLLGQWKERIEQFLPDARVGLIKAKVVDVVDKDIVIASLQSLSMKEYPADVFKGIGFVVIDEVHRTGTEVFSLALHKMNFKYSLGLSATIQRKDGLSRVFTWFIGDVVYKKKRKQDNVRVAIREFYDDNPQYSKEESMFNGKLNLSRMINNVCDYGPRNEVIVDAIIDSVERDQRKVLVLSDRKSQLEAISKGIQTKSKGAVTSGFYIGGMKQAELKESEERQVILATFSFASEGFDAKGLDTLVLASPKTDIEQSVGRILRQKEHERRNVPVIIDIVDTFSIFARQGAKRMTYYKKLKYIVSKIGEDDDDEADVPMMGAEDDEICDAVANGVCLID
jgi:superfamily II DNA or RNA helicase